jgi:hypothetical protein
MVYYLQHNASTFVHLIEIKVQCTNVIVYVLTLWYIVNKPRTMPKE